MEQTNKQAAEAAAPTPEQIKERNQWWADDLKKNDGLECRRGMLREASDADGVEFRCCLMVAADVYCRHTGEPREDAVGNMRSTPSAPVARWFGWNPTNPEFGGWTAIYLNDSSRLPHSKIAELVEQTFVKPKEDDKS